LIVLAHHARFQAIHRIESERPDSPEGRLHGHTFDVTARFDASNGDVSPTAEIDYWIATYMEGTNLTEVLPFPTSGAAIAEHLFGVFTQFTATLVEVEVIVDQGTGFIYRPDPEETP
jgi:hypothetical protein